HLAHIITSLLLFARYGAHRALHSFPTRRSSDLIRLMLTPPETDSTMATAIVSPSARPRPSIDAPMIADRPNGSTVILIISQCVAPSASAASSCRRGVCRNASRTTAVMIGSTMTASTSAATSIVRPVDDGGPANNGIQPRFWYSHVLASTVAGARTASPHSP